MWQFLVTSALRQPFRGEEFYDVPVRGEEPTVVRLLDLKDNAEGHSPTVSPQHHAEVLSISCSTDRLWCIRWRALLWFITISTFTHIVALTVVFPFAPMQMKLITLWMFRPCSSTDLRNGAAMPRSVGSVTSVLLHITPTNWSLPSVFQPQIISLTLYLLPQFCFLYQ